MSKVFISFDYDDIEAKATVTNWANQNIGVDISFSTEEGKSHLSEGVKAVRKILSEKINRAQLVLVLVGNNTHNRPWVDYEVHHAKCQLKKVIWTQIPDTNGTPPKEISKEAGIDFKIDTIRKAIREA